MITFLKGKIGFGIAGFVLTILWIIGAIRIAKPESWWARRFYAGNEDKMRESIERFEEDARYAARIAERQYEDELSS